MPHSDSPAEAHKSDGGRPRLARSAGVFGLATIASRVLGLVRDQVLAFYFGAGDANDAFRVASRIPNLVRDLFAEGAMSAAFVPTFTRQLTLHGREQRHHPTFGARLGYRPNQMWDVGVSASSGSYGAHPRRSRRTTSSTRATFAIACSSIPR